MMLKAFEIYYRKCDTTILVTWHLLWTSVLGRTMDCLLDTLLADSVETLKNTISVCIAIDIQYKGN